MKKLKIVGLIPARSGSQRIKNKNIQKLGEHPLIAYTIASAFCSKLFDEIVCVTDSIKYGNIAKKYGANFINKRPKNISSESSPDIDWVKWILKQYDNSGNFDIFIILRPTSPFRTTKMIKEAYFKFLKENCDSLRAVEVSKFHPGKMWYKNKHLIKPVLNFYFKGVPWHSNQTKVLPRVYIQNASLEISWVKNIKKTNSISGKKIIPFLTKGMDGHDINTKEDLDQAKINLKKFLSSNKNIKNFLEKIK